MLTIVLFSSLTLLYCASLLQGITFSTLSLRAFSFVTTVSGSSFRRPRAVLLLPSPVKVLPAKGHIRRAKTDAGKTGTGSGEKGKEGGEGD